jgi:hypothetical protein
MSAGPEPWTAALVRVDRAARGLPPLPEPLAADVAEILNSVARAARALAAEAAPWQGEEASS